MACFVAPKMLSNPHTTLCSVPRVLAGARGGSARRAAKRRSRAAASVASPSTAAPGGLRWAAGSTGVQDWGPQRVRRQGAGCPSDFPRPCLRQHPLPPHPTTPPTLPSTSAPLSPLPPTPPGPHLGEGPGAPGLPGRLRAGGARGRGVRHRGALLGVVCEVELGGTSLRLGGEAVPDMS